MSRARLLTAIIFVNLSLTGCTLEPMRRAELVAASDPKACEQALSDGAPAGNIGITTEEIKKYAYESTLYDACLAKAIKENPEICVDVLAHGTYPVVTGWGPTKPQAQAIAELTACKFYAKNALEKRSSYTSRLNLDKGLYEGEAGTQGVVVGRIQSAQIENLSTLGSRSGTELGAGLGQVVYFQSEKDLSGYNPWAQLGAGMVGAAVGSSLDTPGMVQYKKTYWVKTNKGDFVSFGHLDLRPILLPETMCVAIINRSQIQQAEEKLCINQ